MTENHEVNVLIVDDRKENLLALEGWLDLPDTHIIKATSGTQALELLLEYDTALVLLDVQMPDMDGFETAEYMRKKNRTRNIPIIFLTAISNLTVLSFVRPCGYGQCIHRALSVL